MAATKAATLSAIAVLALMLSASSVWAQASGATDVDISLPDIVILHYYSNVDVTIDSASLGTYYTGSPGDSTIDEGTMAPATGGFTQDLAMGPSALPGGNPSATDLTLQNAWGVRSISLVGATDTELSISLTDDTLDHTTTTATILISSAAVDDGSSSGATITFPAQGLFSPTVGDVVLTLDLTNAVNAGDYVNAVYTLTAQNI